MVASDDSLSVNWGTVSTTGAGSFGMVATASSDVTNNGLVTTSGTGSYGMFAENGSTALNAVSGDVSTSGAGAWGMVATGAGSSVEKRRRDRDDRRGLGRHGCGLWRDGCEHRNRDHHHFG